MPYKVMKDGDQHCVEKEGGGRVPGGCHSSESDANAHIRALYAAENSKEHIGFIAPEPIKKGFLGIGRKQSTSSVFKDASGSRYMFIITSNGYRDRDNEIITTKALEDYVNASWPADDRCMTKNEHQIWHSIPIGDIVFCDMQGTFLWEISKERAGTFDYEGQTYPIAHVWDYIEQHPEEQWGASHGFKYMSSDRDDGTYEWIQKFETSTLPLRYAANPYTFSGVIDMQDKEKSQRGAFLDKLLGRDGVADELRKAPTALETALTAAGVQHKAMQSDASPAVPTATAETETPATGSDEATTIFNAAWAVIEANNGKEGVTTDQVKQQMLAAIQQQLAADHATETAPPPTPAAKALATTEIGELQNPMEAIKALTKFNNELIDTQAQQSKDLGEVVKAFQALAPVVNAIAGLPDIVTKLGERVGDVEKQLAGRPRIASQDAATKVDENKLSPELQKSMVEYQNYLGVPVKNIPK